MGQKCLFWDILGHGWDTITHTNFAELHMILFFNVLNTLEKASALGRSLVIFKIALSRSWCGGLSPEQFEHQNLA